MPDPSIFGNTMMGVPNQYVTHYHPWPTRYHGPRWMNIEAGGQYREAPYSVGNRTLKSLGGVGCCGCSEAQSGVGAYSPAESSLADAIFGAIAGGVVAYHAPKSDRGALADVLLWALAGAIGGSMLGTMGVGLACAGASISAGAQRGLARR